MRDLPEAIITDDPMQIAVHEARPACANRLQREAKRLIRRHYRTIERVAMALMERRTLRADRIDSLSLRGAQRRSNLGDETGVT